MGFSVVQELMVDGRDLRLHSSGSGQPIVLFHALAASANSWEPIVPALVAAGREVVAVDLPGHGGSEPVRGSEVSVLLQALSETLNQITDETVDLIGHAFGGYLAAGLAAANPAKIRRLVLEEPTLPPRAPGETAPPPKLADKLMPGRPWGQKLPRPASVKDARQASSSIMRGTIDVLKQGRHGFARAKNVVEQLQLPDPEWWERIAAITAPTLVMASAEMLPAEVSALQALTDAISDATLVRATAPHRIHRTAPEEFAALAVPFLAAR